MASSPELDLASLEPVLLQVLRDNPEKVVGWIREEPGCWGFLAGQAVRGCRQVAGRPLSDGERRWVWHRLWGLLEHLKVELTS